MNDTSRSGNTLRIVFIALASVAAVAVVVFAAITFFNKTPDTPDGIGDSSSSHADDASIISESKNTGGKSISLEINQIDASMFPEISLYFSALDDQRVQISNLAGASVEIFDGDAARGNSVKPGYFYYIEHEKQYALTFDSRETPPEDDRQIITLKYADSRYTGETSGEYMPPEPEDQTPIEQLYSAITASSVLNPMRDTDSPQMVEYVPGNAFDGMNETAWVEGVHGDGRGEWIMVEFIRPVKLSGAYIKNGYWKSEIRLNQNNRVKQMRVEFSDGTSDEFSLPDPAGQGFSQMLRGNGEMLEFSYPRSTTYVRFVILDTYSGDSDDDTCISGIQLFR